MCSVRPKCVPLPEQRTLCTMPKSSCRYIDVKTGRTKWERRVAVLVRVEGEPSSKLLIYTYFLNGLGAGKPLIGQIYQLNELKKIEVKRENEGIFILHLVPAKGAKVVFRVSGTDAGTWIAAVLSGDFTLSAHETHAPIHDGSPLNIEMDLKEKPDSHAYTGSRDGYVTPVKDNSGSEMKKEVNSNNNKEKSSDKFRNRFSSEPSEVKSKETTGVINKKAHPEDSEKKETHAVEPGQVQDAVPINHDETPAPQHKTVSRRDMTNVKKTETFLGSKELSEKAPKEPDVSSKAPSAPPPTTQPTPSKGVVAPATEEKRKTMSNSDENENIKL